MKIDVTTTFSFGRVNMIKFPYFTLIWRTFLNFPDCKTPLATPPPPNYYAATINFDRAIEEVDHWKKQIKAIFFFIKKHGLQKGLQSQSGFCNNLF